MSKKTAVRQKDVNCYESHGVTYTNHCATGKRLSGLGEISEAKEFEVPDFFIFRGWLTSIRQTEIPRFCRLFADPI